MKLFKEDDAKLRPDNGDNGQDKGSRSIFVTRLLRRFTLNIERMIVSVFVKAELYI